MHSNFIIHRDIKPGNILLTSPLFGECRVVLADFGLARVVKGGENGMVEEGDVEMTPPPVPSQYSSSSSNRDPFATLTAAICTRWYRPPEALFSSTSYSTPLDLWSAGCVLAELLSDGKVLFKGSSDLEQLFKVLQVVGDVSKIEGVAGKQSAHCESETHSSSTAAGADFNKVSFVGVENKVPLELLVDGDCGDGRVWRVINGLVEADPAKRLTASEALQESWFDEVRNLDRTNPTGSKLLSRLIDEDVSGVNVKCVEDGEKIARRRREVVSGNLVNISTGKEKEEGLPPKRFTRHQAAFLKAFG